MKYVNYVIFLLKKIQNKVKKQSFLDIILERVKTGQFVEQWWKRTRKGSETLFYAVGGTSYIGHTFELCDQQ